LNSSENKEIANVNTGKHGLLPNNKPIQHDYVKIQMKKETNEKRNHSNGKRNIII
jgi:hypothetical protein